MCAIPDAVLYGRRGNDEDSAALFKEECVEFDDNDDIENCEIPINLHPPVSAAESGNLDLSFPPPSPETLMPFAKPQVRLGARLCTSSPTRRRTGSTPWAYPLSNTRGILPYSKIEQCHRQVYCRPIKLKYKVLPSKYMLIFMETIRGKNITLELHRGCECKDQGQCKSPYQLIEADFCGEHLYCWLPRASETLTINPCIVFIN